MIQAEAHHLDWLTLSGAVGSGKVDFLYADPPFNTGKTKRTPPNAKKLEREIDASYADSFGSAAEFTAWLRPRLIASIPHLKPTALICLHVDWRTSHHVRLLMDDLFGADRFVNHLIWSYGLGGSSPRRFARKHDDLLLYCLNPDQYWFDAPRIPATSNRLKGQSKKATDVLLIPAIEEGESGEEKPGAENRGAQGDVLDIPSINNMARERTGYPTQKPFALLDLLVRACCPPGGTILDPCCGSGTTLVAAAMAGRGAIGLDINPAAVEISRKRLAAAATDGQKSARGVP